jgi:isopentenyl-diphosphate Delta-isomerase
MDVILVDERDVPVGSMEKLEVHQKALLHRAFSIFIFNGKGQMLLHKRSEKKYHSAGLWSNACCSHPCPGEDTLAAAKQRLVYEMGIDTQLEKAFDFTYRADVDNGLSEYEFDHVFIGEYDGEVFPDEDEVSEYCYRSLNEIGQSLLTNPQQYTVWFRIAFPKLAAYMKNKS